MSARLLDPQTVQLTGMLWTVSFHQKEPVPSSVCGDTGFLPSPPARLLPSWFIYTNADYWNRLLRPCTCQMLCTNPQRLAHIYEAMSEPRTPTLVIVCVLAVASSSVQCITPIPIRAQRWANSNSQTAVVTLNVPFHCSTGSGKSNCTRSKVPINL